MEKSCLFPGCQFPARAKDLCLGHYQQKCRGEELHPIKKKKSNKSSHCSFPECENLVYARRLCRAHYMQQLRGRTPKPLLEIRRAQREIENNQRSIKKKLENIKNICKLIGPWLLPTAEEKEIMAKILSVIDPDNSKQLKLGIFKSSYGRCFSIIQGIKITKNNYPVVRQKRIFRIVFEAFNNSLIPKGFFVCHHCDQRVCINPKHLFLGTPKDNAIDATQKGHMDRKLHAEDVIEIRRLRKKGFKLWEIAKQFNINYSTVSCICLYKSHSYVKDPQAGANEVQNIRRDARGRKKERVKFEQEQISGMREMLGIPEEE